jgi:hypothetical protein
MVSEKGVKFCSAVFIFSMLALLRINLAAAAFSGNGTGTLADPWQITNCSHLEEMNNSLIGNYSIMNDIDCSDTLTWNSGWGFDPVGDVNTKFNGTLEGNGFSITGLNVNRTARTYVGLFSYGAKSSNVTNLQLTNVNISGRGGGSIAGYWQGGADNLSSSGIVYGVSTTSNVGGLFGYLDIRGKTLNNSYFRGEVYGGDYTGGLIGYKGEGNVTYSHAVVNVTNIGSSEIVAGGLIGYIGTLYNGNTIDHCNASGNVTSASNGVDIGGLIGGISAFNTYINNSFAIVNVSSTGSTTYVGGFFGHMTGASNPLFMNSYAIANVSGAYAVGGFVAYMETSVYQNCFSAGTVLGAGSSAAYVGGFMGFLWSGTINNSYSKANVSAPQTAYARIGGFIGDKSGGGKIQNSYSMGNISTSPSNIYDGGFIGHIGSGSAYTCINCFWDVNGSGYTTSERSIYDGYEVGKTTVQMKNIATFTQVPSSAYDFVGTWDNDTYYKDFWDINSTINDGYPYLVGVTAPATSTIISIEYPLHLSSYADVTVINYTLHNSSTTQNCWYSNSSGWTSAPVAAGINLTGTVVRVGWNNWTVYCNNTANDTYNRLVRFLVDLTPPTISIPYPLNNTNYTSNVSVFNYTAIDESALSNCWYSNNTGKWNSTIYAAKTNFTSLMSNEGWNNWTVYCNDSVGNEGSNITRFWKDTIKPGILVTSPQNNSNSTNTGLAVNYTISDLNLDKCWYSNDSMIRNTTLDNCVNITSVVWSEGPHNVSVWVNDTSGNENKSSVRFTIDLTGPAINFTPPTPENDTRTANTSVYINASIVESSFAGMEYKWNGTNYTIYNNSLILMMNFDNLSALGENTSYFADVSIYNISGNCSKGGGLCPKLNTTSGKYGNAVTFDGKNDFIEVKDNSLLSFVNNNSFAISAWIAPNGSSSQTTNHSILGKGNSAQWEYLLSIAKNKTSFVLFNLTGNNVCSLSSAANISANTWQHIAVTFNDSNCYIYLNGRLDASASRDLSASAGDGNQRLFIGSGRDSASLNYFNGSIDEVRIWNRSITETEAYELYASNLRKFNTTQWYFYVNQSSNATDVLTSENYTYLVYASDSLGNLNRTEARAITIQTDVAPPNITIEYPSNSTNYTSNASVLNYTAVDASALSKCWYSNNSGKWNSSTYPAGTNFTDLISNEGWNNWTVYCNDSIGNEGSNLTRFFKDTIFPLLGITSPANYTNTSDTGIDINYTFSELNPDKCWYSNDSMSRNITLDNCANITNVIWSEGPHNVTVWVNDTSGNENSSKITLVIDTIAPAINIYYPSNNTNYTINASVLNYTVSDATELSRCWYSNNSGKWNSTYSAAGTNFTDLISNEGWNNWTVYCNDSADNVGSNRTMFFRDTIPPAFAELSNQTIEYYNSLNYGINATDSSGISCFTVNDSVNFKINCSGYLQNNSIINASLYRLNITANDTLGNLNSTIILVNVTDITPPNVTLNIPTAGYYNDTSRTINVTFNCSATDNYNLSNLSLYVTNSGNVSIALNQTSNITGVLNSSAWTINLSNGSYTWNCIAYDFYNNSNWSNANRSIIINFTDSDNDGLPDTRDNLTGNESNVNSSGISKLNITVGGNSTYGTFNGTKEIVFYDYSTRIINFTYNFSVSKLDLRRVRIIVSNTSVIVNMSGQLQQQYNKTVYIDDNDFSALCVKDAEIESADNISSGCNGANETDFTACLGGSAVISGVTCADEGSRIRIENLRFSGIRGTPRTAAETAPASSGTSSGGGGGWESFIKEVPYDMDVLKLKVLTDSRGAKIDEISNDKNTSIKQVEVKTKNWITGDIYIKAFGEKPEYCSIEYDGNYRIFKVLNFNSTITSEDMDSARVRVGVPKEWIFGNNISTIIAVKCYPSYREIPVSYYNETETEGIYDIYSDSFSVWAILGTIAKEAKEVGKGLLPKGETPSEEQQRGKEISNKESLWIMPIAFITAIIIVILLSIIINETAKLKAYEKIRGYKGGSAPESGRYGEKEGTENISYTGIRKRNRSYIVGKDSAFLDMIKGD